MTDAAIYQYACSMSLLLIPSKDDKSFRLLNNGKLKIKQIVDLLFLSFNLNNYTYTRYFYYVLEKTKSKPIMLYLYKKFLETKNENNNILHEYILCKIVKNLNDLNIPITFLYYSLCNLFLNIVSTDPHDNIIPYLNYEKCHEKNLYRLLIQINEPSDICNIILKQNHEWDNFDNNQMKKNYFALIRYFLFFYHTQRFEYIPTLAKYVCKFFAEPEIQIITEDYYFKNNIVVRYCVIANLFIHIFNNKEFNDLNIKMLTTFINKHIENCIFEVLVSFTDDIEETTDLPVEKDYLSFFNRKPNNLFLKEREILHTKLYNDIEHKYNKIDPYDIIEYNNFSYKDYVPLKFSLTEDDKFKYVHFIRYYYNVFEPYIKDLIEFNKEYLKKNDYYKSFICDTKEIKNLMDYIKYSKHYKDKINNLKLYFSINGILFFVEDITKYFGLYEELKSKEISDVEFIYVKTCEKIKKFFIDLNMINRINFLSKFCNYNN